MGIIIVFIIYIRLSNDSYYHQHQEEDDDGDVLIHLENCPRNGKIIQGKAKPTKCSNLLYRDHFISELYSHTNKGFLKKWWSCVPNPRHDLKDNSKTHTYAGMFIAFHNSQEEKIAQMTINR